MDGIRNVTSTSWAHEYNNKIISNQQEFVAPENEKPVQMEWELATPLEVGIH